MNNILGETLNRIFEEGILIYLEEYNSQSQTHYLPPKIRAIKRFRNEFPGVSLRVAKSFIDGAMASQGHS